MAISNEHQLKFNAYKTAKSLIEAIEKRFEVNTAHGVSIASSETNASNLPNGDSLSDVVIYSFFASRSNSPQLDNKDLKQIDPDDLEEIDLKWQMAMATKHQDNKNREAPKRNVPVEDTTSNALVTQCDGLGYDWSDQAKDGPINFALIAYTSLSSSSYLNSDTVVSTYFKACLKSYETLKEHYDNLTKDFNKSQFNLDDKKILKLDVMLRDKAIIELRQKFKKAKKERDDLKLTLENFKGSSKNLSRLLDSQQSDKSKTDLGFASQGVDSQVLEISESVTSLPDIAKSEVKTSETKLKNFSAPIIKDWVSNSEDEDKIETDSKQIKPSFAKEKFVKSTEHVKSPRKSIKQVKSNRQTKYPRKTSQSPRVLTNFGLKILNTARHPSSRAAVPVNTARPINTVYPRSTVNGAKPRSNVFHKSHSLVRRTFNQRTTPQNSDLKETINTAKVKNVTTARTKAIVSAVQGNRENAVKSSECWIWRPTGNVINHISKDSGSYMLKRFNYIDLQGRLKSDQGIFDSGCSRHMTRNKSFLIDFQEIDGGFIAFRGSPKKDHLGKFERKANEGFLVGYSINNKAFKEKASDHEYILLPFMPSHSPLSSSTQSSDDKDADEAPGKGDEGVSKGSEMIIKKGLIAVLKMLIL
nr:hypothetical protein [Tanacetum cinerariifolium]